MSDLKRELKQIGSVLDPANKPAVKPVPDNYFEEMQNNVLNEVLQNTTFRLHPDRKGFGQLIFRISGIAAVLLIVLGLWIFNRTTSQNNSVNLDDLDQNLAFSYLESNLKDISLDMLLSDQMIPEDDFLFEPGEADDELDHILEDLDMNDITDIY